MATKLLLFRGREQESVLVPQCPMFDFDRKNNTPEVAALVAAGFHVGGHIDGEPDDKRV